MDMAEKIFKRFIPSKPFIGSTSWTRCRLSDYSRSEQMKDDRDVKKAVIMFIGKNKYELFEDR